MRVEPIKPITQTYYRRHNPYMLYQCEACDSPGRVVEVAGEPRLLCHDCTDYMKRVQKALPKDSLEWFDAVGPICKRIAYAGIIGFVVYYGIHMIIWALR